MDYRHYQEKGDIEIHNEWAKGYKYVLYVLPTGGGKTVVFSNIMRKNIGPSCAIAHRSEIVAQISLALAKNKLKHRIIAPKAVIKNIIKLHIHEVGDSFYDPNAQVAVAGVDTLINRKEQLKHWLNTVTLWVQDESHHVLTGNKWGEACRMFPNARGLGVTANTIRADGYGLGSDADGVMQVLIQGPSGRDLINWGYLTDYKIFLPESDIDLHKLAISKKTGDYVKTGLVQCTRESSIVGDVVKSYLKIAPGKLGMTFTPDTETAALVAANFKKHGVSAEVVTAKTPMGIRYEIMRRFKRREIMQLVNVDLFGEGVDVPALEVISMARATASDNLYCQQFGRVLRILEGKNIAIVIDHVGNVLRHNLPDRYRVWSLDRRERRSKGSKDPDLIPMRRCGECEGAYEATHDCCPYCGHYTPPPERSSPEFVDGNLVELDPSVLAQMRADVEKIDTEVDVFRMNLERSTMPGIAIAGATKSHRIRQETQEELRGSIALWAGYQRSMGRPDTESYKRFYWKFGVDVLSAQALGKPDAIALNTKVIEQIEVLKNEIM